MQLRTFFAASAIGLSLACIAGFASAQQIYKWKDAGGVTHFSQTPPANGAHYTRMRLTSEPEVSATQPGAAAGTSAANADDNVGIMSQGAGNQTTQADTPANRTELCKQLGSNISLLQSRKPVVTTGNDGKQQLMNDNAREQQLATARAQQTQYCAGGG